MALHLAVIYRPDSMALYYISKPALIFSLLSFFIHKSEGINARLKLFISLGLIFSLLGDVVLMFEGEMLFLVGMGAFALAHLSYIGFYTKQKLSFSRSTIVVSSLAALLGIYALYRFVHTPTELAPYLYLYAFIISVHLVISTGFIRLGNTFSYWPALGALAFIISDFLLAINLFNEESLGLKLGVMLTYAAAQYLIVIGVTRVLQSEKEIEES